MLEKKNWSNIFAKISNIVGGICILAMMALITVEVLARNIFHTSTLISDEYSGYLMVFITYWGAATAFHSGSFVRVEALFDHFPQRVRVVLNYVYEFLFLVFNSYLCFYFLKALLDVITYGSVASTVARTPLWIPYSICWVGIFTFEVYLIVNLIEKITNKNKEEKEV